MGPDAQVDAELVEELLRVGADALAFVHAVGERADCGGQREDLVHADPGRRVGDALLAGGEDERAGGGAVAVRQHARVEPLLADELCHGGRVVDGAARRMQHDLGHAFGALARQKLGERVRGAARDGAVGEGRAVRAEAEVHRPRLAFRGRAAAPLCAALVGRYRPRHGEIGADLVVGLRAVHAHRAQRRHGERIDAAVERLAQVGEHHDHGHAHQAVEGAPQERAVGQAAEPARKALADAAHVWPDSPRLRWPASGRTFCASTRSGGAGGAGASTGTAATAGKGAASSRSVAMSSRRMRS